MITLENVAGICHEANRAYCEALNDFSQPSWDTAPAWQRDSAVNGVRFKIDNPNSTPEQSHDNWLKVKESDGWQYGEVKDPVRKIHPCFRPYNELPIEQRLKDAIFQNIVSAFLDAGVLAK